jgi:hypothetical protein
MRGNSSPSPSLPPPRGPVTKGLRVRLFGLEVRAPADRLGAIVVLIVVLAVIAAAVVVSLVTPSSIAHLLYLL